ncbi:hypothetical protein [Nocardioides sp. Soil796]|uniref:hypothetical protein n=1 Tax=Nocardioides sp. Soil796 TaxID=1736412 RepID=UPI00070C199F|nr:hypothetical protein [Nocardioides sp. Soil796]KRF12967.1 hypothetical protein ASH02_15780 [Nocardioides sp. Soil796]
MSIKLPRTAIAAVLASTLLLAGCSDDGDKDDKDSKQSSSQAADPSDDASTDSDEETESTGGELTELEAGEFYETVIDAQIAAETFKGTTTTTAAGQTITMNMEASYKDGKTASHVTTEPGAAQAFEAVLIDGVMYLKGDGLPGATAGKWQKIDSSDPNNPFGQLLEFSDPKKSLSIMEDPKKFELVGEEDVDGVAANHYVVTIDSASYVEKLGLPAEIKDLMPPELTYDMWVDAENRPVKMTQEITIQGQKTSTEILYSDYGTAVDIQEPAASEVATS